MKRRNKIKTIDRDRKDDKIEKMNQKMKNSTRINKDKNSNKKVKRKKKQIQLMIFNLKRH